MGDVPSSSISSTSHYGSSALFGLTSTAAMMAPTATTPFLSSTATALFTALSTPSPTPISPGGDDKGECALLGPFAIFVQAALGALALLSLVFKRWRERPQRPIKIWAFDASKQVVGSILLHLANLLMSELSSGQLDVGAVAAQAAQGSGGQSANPCSFYLLNLGIDTTLGIPILIILLRLLTHGFSLTWIADPPESIQSGNYGNPPRATWWMKQCLIYFIGLLGMKACVYFIFTICPWIIIVGNWALRWTEGNETLQVVFVMLVFPVIMNALQYYIIDGFIKNQKPAPQGEEGEPEDSRDGERGNQEEDDSVVGDDENKVKAGDSVVGAKEVGGKGLKSPKGDAADTDEYNPEQDGDDASLSGGSASSSSVTNEEQQSLLAGKDGKKGRASKR